MTDLLVSLTLVSASLGVVAIASALVWGWMTLKRPRYRK